MNHMNHYYVDESGDGVLFDSNGKSLIDSENGSRYFMLGLLQVSDPISLSQEMEALRADLLADPYFNDVPSMQAKYQKTAIAFHAKDDVSEVRREVFKLLSRHNLKFFAVIRDMQNVLAYVRQRNVNDPNYRYKPNDLYDNTVARAFKDRLHQNATTRIQFAKRGKADRTSAFVNAVQLAKSRFESKWDRVIDADIKVTVTTPETCIPLQAVDYILWALQRHYIKDESRFLDAIWDKVSLIHAVDETTVAPYGAYYTKKNPIKKKPPANEVAL